MAETVHRVSLRLATVLAAGAVNVAAQCFEFFTPGVDRASSGFHWILLLLLTAAAVVPTLLSVAVWRVFGGVRRQWVAFVLGGFAWVSIWTVFSYWNAIAYSNLGDGVRSIDYLPRMVAQTMWKAGLPALLSAGLVALMERRQRSQLRTKTNNAFR